MPGVTGGEPLGHPETNGGHPAPVSSDSKKRRFVPPTPQEAEAYALTLDFKLDGAYFVAHYTARGWKYGPGRPVVDWKACIVTWKKRDAQGGPNGRKPEGRIAGAAGYQPGKYDHLVPRRA